MKRISLKLKAEKGEKDLIDDLIWETAFKEVAKFFGQIPTNSVLAKIVCAIEFAIDQEFGIDATALIDIENNGEKLCISDIWVNCY
jgi:hypothetical protein